MVCGVRRCVVRVVGVEEMDLEYGLRCGVGGVR